MNRERMLTALLVMIGALASADLLAQNLEAGKSPGQIFSNTCSACHRSPRGLVRTVAPASLPGFLREHYTTSRDMAQQLAGFLIANGATDTRGRPQEARRSPGSAGPQDAARPPGQVEREQTARPPVAEAPRTEPVDPRQARRERRAKAAAEAAAAQSAAAPTVREERRQKNRRITPARIEAASQRGKDALPLGAVPVEPARDQPPPEAAVAVPSAGEASRPDPAPAPAATTRSDPVPEVTPAPPGGVAERPAPEPAPPASAPAAGPEAGGSSSSAGEAEAPDPPAPTGSDAAPPTPPISK